MTAGPTPEDLHQRALAFNFDDGTTAARAIALHPDCDRATTLLMYWRNSPHHYRRYAEPGDAPAHARDAVTLSREAEARLLADDFTSRRLFYDPKHDAVDRTRASEEEQLAASRAIPDALYLPCGTADPVDAAAARLERTCWTGALDDVERALGDGTWERLGQAERRTLLQVAVQNDHCEVVARLADAGVSPNFSRDHRTPLDDAAGLAMIDVLTDHGADPAKATLALAVTKGPDVVRRLVELGTPIDGMSRWGEPAVYRAAVDGHVEVLSALIELGADRELPRSSDGKTALQGVDERLEVLRALLTGDLPYDAPERTEQGLLTSARIALTGNRKDEDARYW